MKLLASLSFLFPLICWSAPFFHKDMAFEVNEKKKTPAPLAEELPNFYFESEMVFDSYDGNEKSNTKPLMGSETFQTIRLKQLPKSAKGESRLELLFEKFEIKSKALLGSKPFETKMELGKYISDKPIVLVAEKDNFTRVEGVETIRARIEAEVKDPMAKGVLLQMFQKDLLLSSVDSYSSQSSCLKALAGKVPGEKWSFSRESQGITMKFECKFLGWSSAKGRDVLVIEIAIPKSQQKKKQANGAMNVLESEGRGKLYFEPNSKESLVLVTTTIFVEPTKEEIQRLEKRGARVPRNRSISRASSQIIPMVSP